MKGLRTRQLLALCGLALLGWGLLASPLLHSLEHALGRRHAHGGAHPHGRGRALGAQGGPSLGLSPASDACSTRVTAPSSHAHERAAARGHQHEHEHGYPHEHSHERDPACDHQHEYEREHGHHQDADEPLDTHGAGSLEHLMLAGLEAPPLPWPALPHEASTRAPASPPALLALATRHRPEQPQGP